MTIFSFKFIKNISTALLLLMGLHSLTIHGIAESFIYCIEADGEINIESTSDFTLGFESKMDKHDESLNNHEHSGADIHQTPENHQDFSITESCIKDNRVNRLDQNKTIEKIYTDLYQSFSFLPNSAKKQKTSFIPPNIEQQDLASLETVVLLN
ncbi:MAG: hypothetical protein ABJR05_14655 [Balneola sp.]